MSAATHAAPSRWRRLCDEGAVLTRLVRGMPRSGSAQQRLEGFYAGQASAYDAFRARLLRGRAELLAALPLPRGALLVELGGGTGATLEMLGTKRLDCARIEVVDLCRPLLDLAAQRAARHGWRNVVTIAGDAQTYVPERPADAVVLSYALTMMPDWRACLANAWRMLKPGGRIAVVDFTVGTPGDASGQSVFARWMWTRWFAHDGVRLSPLHRQALREGFVPECDELHRTRLPWLGLSVPHLRFIGRRIGGDLPQIFAESASLPHARMS